MNNALWVAILRQLFGGAVDAFVAREEPAIVQHLEGHPGHAYNSADVPGFIRHATRQIAVVAEQMAFKKTHGGGIADEFRNFFVPRISAEVTPLLTPNLNTAQAVAIVASAVEQSIQALEGGA